MSVEDSPFTDHQPPLVGDVTFDVELTVKLTVDRDGTVYAIYPDPDAATRWDAPTGACPWEQNPKTIELMRLLKAQVVANEGDGLERMAREEMSRG